MSSKLTLSDLKQDDQNANTGTDRGRTMVHDSIQELGSGRSILVDKNAKIIAGNKTASAAGEQNMPIRVIESDGSELIVVQRTDLDLDSKDDKTARKLAYADNRAGEIGLDWDVDQIVSDIASGLQLDELFTKTDLKIIGIDFDDLGVGDDGGDDEFKKVDDDLPTNCECPKCGYTWSQGQ